MSELDEKRSSYEKKLEAIIARRKASLEADLAAVGRPPVNPSSPGGNTGRPGERASAPPTHGFPAGQAQVSLNQAGALRALDESFMRTFQVESYFPINRLDYPTVYCETLEEFYAAIATGLDLSPQARQGLVKAMAKEALEAAEQSGAVTYGVNLPGQGCYLNGWMVVYRLGISPQAAFQAPDLARRILKTVIHEKLGHGFLTMYSALGAVNTSLGLDKIELANKFGLRPADTPLSSLRQQQANVIFMVSQFLEEGWATWVEHYLAAQALGERYVQPYTLEMVTKAIAKLPAEVENRPQLQEALLGALYVLFGPEEAAMESLLMAIRIMGGVGLDDYFGAALGQPLRYVVGSLLMSQAEANLGCACAPYAALIAANLTFDPNQLSLVDLANLLTNDPRLNPDTRLAALSRLRLSQPGQVKELARLAEAALSISAPPEIKR